MEKSPKFHNSPNHPNRIVHQIAQIAIHQIAQTHWLQLKNPNPNVFNFTNLPTPPLVTSHNIQLHVSRNSQSTSTILCAISAELDVVGGKLIERINLGTF